MPKRRRPRRGAHARASLCFACYRPVVLDRVEQASEIVRSRIVNADDGQPHECERYDDGWLRAGEEIRCGKE